MRNINRWLSKTSVTHLLLDGGTLSAKEGFYEDYVFDVLNGEKLCVVEKKTPQFRFFVDVDFVSDENELDFEKVALEISKVVSAGTCVIAKAEPRKTPKGTKYGMHMIWPDSVVNKQRANSTRIKILDEFGSDWEHIIDSSVYSGSGLRMLWSYKNEPGSTQYVPWGKIDGETCEFREFKNKDPSRHFLELFSIRISSSTTSHILEDSKSEKSTGELETFIRMNIPGQETAKVTRVGKCKNKKDYWVRTNSRYCEHVKRDHKSNHVWFVLSPKGCTICQKCEDEECKNWKGRLYRIPSRLIPNEGILDSDSHRNINDYLPDGWKLNF
jgi:hypothetical protein